MKTDMRLPVLWAIIFITLILIFGTEFYGWSFFGQVYYSPSEDGLSVYFWIVSGALILALAVLSFLIIKSLRRRTQEEIVREKKKHN